MQIKNSKGWFPFGIECEKALHLLSDGAFRLYLYLCSRAFRSTGRYQSSFDQLAQEINRSKRSVSAYTEELREKRVITVRTALNQHAITEFEISNSFWPYVKAIKSKDEDAEHYLLDVQRMLKDRACVKAQFSSAEQTFTTELLLKGITIGQIQQAINLGCARKYVSLLNNNDQKLVTSFLYFRDVIEEVVDAVAPNDYWQFVELQRERLERQWLKFGLSPNEHAS